MQLHIIKKNNEFVLVNPPQDLADKFFIEIDRENIIPEEKIKESNSQESNAFKKTQVLYKQNPKDDFIKALHESTPPHYQYKASDKTDDDLLYDALKAKYELEK
ncbi:hypothetical protein [Marinilabilia salmonicolor]|uniref:hypothetical protein n=1 Tax=Marinilabilia salmonicolor TaxID=989 RepID=UPI00029B234A|nr:hypothetical protein [Marinilabilia salmonicolor]